MGWGGVALGRREEGRAANEGNSERERGRRVREARGRGLPRMDWGRCRHLLRLFGIAMREEGGGRSQLFFFFLRCGGIVRRSFRCR